MTKNKNIVLDLIIFLVAGVILSSVVTIIVTQIAGFGLTIEPDALIVGLPFYTLPSIVISSIVFIVAYSKNFMQIKVFSYLLMYSIAYAISLSVPFFIIKLSNPLIGSSIGDLGFIIVLLTSLPLTTPLLFAIGIKVFKKIIKKQNPIYR